MVFWRPNKLIEKYNSGRISNAEQFGYYVGLIVIKYVENVIWGLQIIGSYATVVNSETIGVCFALLGATYVYFRNRATDPTHFIEKFVLLWFPVSIRIESVFLPIYIILYAADVGNKPSHPVAPMGFVWTFYIILWVIIYTYMGKKMELMAAPESAGANAGPAPVRIKITEKKKQTPPPVPIQITEKKKQTPIPFIVLGGLSFIPMVGFVIGLLSVIISFFSFRKFKVLFILGISGMVFTMAIIGWLYFVGMIPGTRKYAENWVPMDRYFLKQIQKDLVLYRNKHGDYPKQLQDLHSQDPYLTLKDPLTTWIKNYKGDSLFYYKTTADSFQLFSVGLDGKPYTKDDIFPDSSR